MLPALLCIYVPWCPWAKQVLRDTALLWASRLPSGATAKVTLARLVILFPWKLQKQWWILLRTAPNEFYYYFWLRIYQNIFNIFKLKHSTWTYGRIPNINKDNATHINSLLNYLSRMIKITLRFPSLNANTRSFN